MADQQFQAFLAAIRDGDEDDDVKDEDEEDEAQEVNEAEMDPEGNDQKQLIARPPRHAVVRSASGLRHGNMNQVIPVGQIQSYDQAIQSMTRDVSDDMTFDQLKALLNTWYYVWCHFQSRDLEESQRRQRILFQATSPADYNKVMKTYEDYQGRIVQLLQQMNDIMTPEERKENEDLGDKFNQIMHNIKSMYESVLLSILTMNPNIALPIGSDLKSIQFQPIDLSNFNPTLLLLYTYLRHIKLLGYARMGDRVVKRIFSPDGYDTHAWEDTGMDIPALVYRLATPEQFQGGLFTGLFSSGRSDQTLIRQLQVIQHRDFPDIQPDRHIASFVNGIYFRKSDQFIPYTSEEFRMLRSDVISSKYFPVKFEHELYDSIMNADPEEKEQNEEQIESSEEWKKYHSRQKLPRKVPDRFMKIPTPLIDKIMMDQGWKYETRRMFLVMMGRMLYELKEKDNWQVAPFLYGRGGTGKSLLMELIKYMYETNRVGVLNNSVEAFYLEGLLNKYILIASDIKSDFGMSQTDFNMQVAGEMMNWARKNKTPIMKEFTIPSMYLCNLIPRYTNAGNSFLRRVILFFFGRDIKEANTTLFNTIKTTEFAAFMKKINMAYQWGVETFSDTSLQDRYLPEEMVAWRKFVVTHTNSLAKFIDVECTRGERYYVPFATFEKRAIQWSKEHMERIVWDKTSLDDLFATFNIVVKENEPYKELNGTTQRGKVMYGITLTASKMILGDEQGNAPAAPAAQAQAPVAQQPQPHRDAQLVPVP